MKIRIFERDSSLQSLLDLICRMVSPDVEVSDRPQLCDTRDAVLAHADCPGHCRSVLIVDAHLIPTNGLAWTKTQCASNCRIDPSNILLLATHLSEQDQALAASLGCAVMRKPFNTSELILWLKSRLSARSS